MRTLIKNSIQLAVGMILLTVCISGLALAQSDTDATIEVLKEGIVRVGQDNIITRITHWEGGLPSSCVGSSRDFGKALATRFTNDGRFEGWRIQQVTNMTGGHTALVLTSPDGSAYFVDNYFFHPEIEPIIKVGNAYVFDPLPGHTTTGAYLFSSVPWKPTSGGIDITIGGSSPPPTETATPASGIPEGETDHQVDVEESKDPNEKTGPRGYGLERHTRGDSVFGYSVWFENLASAGAAAQVVSIKDNLDTNLDANSFQLGPISFGNHSLMPWPGQTSYLGYIDLRPDTSIVVKVEASLDYNYDNDNYFVSWIFSSLDATSCDPDWCDCSVPSSEYACLSPLDPASTGGALPPNVNPPEGQGHVSFLISPVSGLSSGTVISNSASITFDTNDPIQTATWSNTIDREKPSSSVTPLAASTRKNSAGTFNVSWSGSDALSGIKGYRIFVGQNGETDYSPWINNIAETSGGFPHGEACKTYSFLSVATDNAGNVEDFPAVPDTSTKVLPSGDIDGDGDIDNNDLTILLRDRNKTVANSACGIKCDLDCDGKITVLDGRILATVCTRPRCATQ